MEKDIGTTAFRGLRSSQAELQSPVGTELRNLDSIALKGAMMQEGAEILPEVVDLGFLTANTGVKHAFVRFFETALTAMLHHVIIGRLIYSGFER